jgi:hypothetical protein
MALAALDAIERVTGERQVHTIGYCVGGTLLATTSPSWRANLTSVARQLFRSAGRFHPCRRPLVFVDEEQIAAREQEMDKRGYLEGKKMANAFNLLRSNDLIWPYVINNYLKGKEPAPFDLLYWNSDATRMPAANHSFYLRNCYLENRLSKGDMVVGGKKLDLKKVKIPIYNLATREDHIAPAKSVLLGSKFFGGPVRFVLAGSGHIAGVVNPPDKMKYQYWTGPKPSSANLDSWLAKAKEHASSWWPDWFECSKLDPEKVPARTPGGGILPPIEDAPGAMLRSGINGYPARAGWHASPIQRENDYASWDSAVWARACGPLRRSGARAGAYGHAQEDQRHRRDYARSPRVLVAVLVLRRPAAGRGLCHGPLLPDRRWGEEQSQARQARGQAQSRDLGHPHPVDGERHHRPRVRLDHQQSRAAEAGLLHHHAFRHRQPLRLQESREPEDGGRPQGQDRGVDLGHHQHQADHRDRRTQKGLGLNILAAKDHAEAFLMVETGRAAAFVMDDILLFSLVAGSKAPQDYVISTDALGRALRHHAPPRGPGVQEGGR